MDAAEFHRIADRYGAPAEERDHALDKARWDLEHRPETVHGRDVHRIAADDLTASRARPMRFLEEVKLKDPYAAYEPGGFQSPRRRQVAEARARWAQWWKRHRAEQEAAGRF